LEGRVGNPKAGEKGKTRQRPQHLYAGSPERRAPEKPLKRGEDDRRRLTVKARREKAEPRCFIPRSKKPRPKHIRKKAQEGNSKGGAAWTSPGKPGAGQSLKVNNKRQARGGGGNLRSPEKKGIRKETGKDRKK